jgi:hypothetical protein
VTEPSPTDLVRPTERERAIKAMVLGASLGALLAFLGRRRA